MDHVASLAAPRPADATRPLMVLAVDDDELFLEYLTLELETLNCMVLAAANAEQAIRFLDHHAFDVCITDWQMPGMDGLALVQQLRSRHGPDQFLHVVMTTARGDARTVRAALDAGVDGFLFKPLDRLQLELAMASARRNVLLHQRLRRRNHHLAVAHGRTREAYRRMEADLEAAAALHRQLLPAAHSAGDRLRLAWTYRPAQHISGDTIGVIPLRDGKRLFFLADAQGHGVPAALTSFHIHHRLAQLAPDTPTALEVALAELNREINAQALESYVTLICGVLSPGSGDGCIVRAGHPAPLLIGPDGIDPMKLEGAFPIGWFEHATFEAEPLRLAPGTQLFLYSDGVTEARDKDGVELELVGLRDMLTAAPGASVDAVVSHVDGALRARRGNAGLEDDISILALEIKGDME